MHLHTLLNIDENAKCISVCGSGGKSSLCLALAKEAVLSGKHAAITTTTHIGIPHYPVCKVITDDIIHGMLEAWKQNKVPIIGRQEGDKLTFVGVPQLSTIQAETDILYIEADGSKMLPLKYPNATEPVLPAHTDTVIVVCGLSAYGKALDDVCHRVNLARENIDRLNTFADIDAITRIIWTGYHKYDPMIVLNQADTDDLQEVGNRIKDRLERSGAKSISVISLKNMGLASEKFF